MKTNFQISPNQRLSVIVTVVGIILLIPMIAMQFTDEVKWTISDFIVAGILLLGTGLAIEFVLRTIRSTQIRLLLFGFILFVLFLVWAELAVGIFGSPWAGN
ncbi:hypothetical protein [Flavobacterium filum]|uniref:hypothetical protein n=1 Tax=Flavobacterium filum TaxID=370974 RepID=UPI0023F29331|nr:hypothetical protein [Flavobacterium filum]